MRAHVIFACVVCLVSFASESGAWFWPFSKAKDDEKAKIDGGWSSWGPWSSCMQEENPQRRYKERTCSSPAPRNGGSTCEGNARRTTSCKNCTRALGLESGEIKDSQVSSPSSHWEFPAFNGRLHGDSSWCADIQEDEIYFQVDFENLTKISAIATQGFYPDPKVMSLRRGRVTKYELMYSQDGLSWELYTTASGNSELPGNKQKLGTVTNVLKPQIKARLIRIYPLGFYSFMCMRVELYGCPVTCGGHLTEYPGVLDVRSSELEDKDCLWLVDLPNMRKVHFDFVNFDVPCTNGGLVIRDGSVSYEAAPVLGRYCGLDTVPPPVVGNKGKLWVHFVSNSSDPHVGFYANYFPGCGGHLNGSDGILESPNYPKNYFHNSKCTWTITVPEGKTIHLTFPHFDVDGDVNRHRCPSDHVTIWDRVELGVPVLGRFCNSKPPPALICSSNNTLKLKFRTDEVVAQTGFLAQYRAVESDAVCFASSSLPTMSLTPSSSPSWSSYGVISPSTSVNLLITKATAYTTSSTYAVLQPIGQPNKTTASKPKMSTVISSFGNMSRNVSKNEDPNLLARQNADDEDDDKDDLITIIIISAFGFVVVCLIIASIVPGIKNNCEKRTKEKESNYLGVEIGAQRNSNGEPQYDGDFTGFEAKESSVFLPKETGSQVFSSQESIGELPPEYDVDSVMLKPEEPNMADSPSIHSETNCFAPAENIQLETEPGNEPEESNFNLSCEDLSKSFALEMHAMMRKLMENVEDDDLELKNAQSLPKNSRNSMYGSDSQHGGTAGDGRQSPADMEQAETSISNTSTGNGTYGCVADENPQSMPKPSLDSKPQSPVETTDQENCSSPCVNLPTPWHVQPDRSSSRTRAAKPKGTSASSYAESKDSGCASSLENLHDAETCV